MSKKERFQSEEDSHFIPDDPVEARNQELRLMYGLPLERSATDRSYEKSLINLGKEVLQADLADRRLAAEKSVIENGEAAHLIYPLGEALALHSEALLRNSVTRDELRRLRETLSQLPLETH